MIGVRGGSCLLLVSLAAHVATPAAQTRRLAVSPQQLLAGSAEGMAITERGRLFPAPRIEALTVPEYLAPASFARAAVADGANGTFVGTGPGGHVLRVTDEGRWESWFETDEPLVTALALAGNGDLLVATAPGGVVYRVAARGQGMRWAETGEAYVWALATTTGGRVFAATGGRGRILELGSDGRPETWFDSHEPHVTSLVAVGDEGLVAGSAGDGLIWQLDRDGNALVLFDGALDEVASLAVDPEGRIVAAMIAAQAAPRPQPWLEIRLPEGAVVGRAGEGPSPIGDPEGPPVRGEIEGLTPVVEPPVPSHGRVVRIDPEGVAETLWESAGESPYRVALDDRGRVIFGTGAPARLYRLEPDGDVARLATLTESQITALVPAGGAVRVATSNPARLYHVGTGAVERAVYDATPLDAGAPSRWGKIGWKLSGPANRVELYTRTGNSREPDPSWSGWGPAMTDPEAGIVVNPDGRFLQWRVRWSAGGAAGGRLSSVTVLHEPFNRPPAIRGLRADARSSSGPVGLHWSDRDPDGDPVAVRLEFRPVGADAWATAAVSDLATSATEGTLWRSGDLEWDTSSLPEGEYEIRALASDDASNPPGEGRSAIDPARPTVVIDRTPPGVELEASAGEVRLVVRDLHSRIERVELLESGRRRAVLRPVDGLCDSHQEQFRFEPAATGTWTLRVVDEAGNAVERSLGGDA